MAAMSFDQYFDSIEKQSRQSQNSDDWYAIVEEALYAADIMAARLHRQQLEASLMKPLPMIPEDDAVESPTLRSRAEIVRPKTADATCSKGKASWRLEVQQHISEMPKDLVASRQRSSMYDIGIDFDSPLSPESEELDAWVGNACSTSRNSMSSLRSKPYTRQSSYTDSAVSERRISVSAGSSILARSSKSTSSSMYSTDTSIDSPISSTMCSCKHSPRPSENSVAAAPRKVRSEDSAKECFFEFSDAEEEGKGKEEEVTVARPQSSGSNYVKHLRQKALSLRIATSKLARFRVRTTSLPAQDGPALPSWLSLSRRSSADVDRNPASTMEYDPWECKLDNELMFGAAASAKAKRVLGM
ncbi:hypothetical protein Q7P35_000889 [Cladosporium inversicolor]